MGKNKTSWCGQYNSTSIHCFIIYPLLSFLHFSVYFVYTVDTSTSSSFFRTTNWLDTRSVSSFFIIYSFIPLSTLLRILVVSFLAYGLLAYFPASVKKPLADPLCAKHRSVVTTRLRRLKPWQLFRSSAKPLEMSIISRWFAWILRSLLNFLFSFASPAEDFRER